MNNQKLKALYQKVDRCKFCKAAKNPLRHIHGFGVIRPRLMLILINPTYRNLSSDSKYKGVRFPFIGVRQFWRVLADGGLINKKIADGLPLRSQWTKENTQAIQKELLKNKLFITNTVKCCYNHSQYPDQKVINAQLDFLREEINIVRPQKIVAFGGLVFQILTALRSIVLFKYWQNSAKRKIYKEQISGRNIPVTPCYFPVGRGNPKKAVLILKNLI